MDVYQCPECELRFRSPSELDSHLRDDHPSFQASSGEEDFVFTESHRHRHQHVRGYRPREDN